PAACKSFPELAGAKPVANLSPAVLIETILARGEAKLSARGAVTAETGEFTGRTPPNRYIVKDKLTAETVAWGATNQAISEDLFAGGDPAYRLKVRVVNEMAWHNLFVHQLFLRPTAAERRDFTPDFTIVSMPGCKAVPAEDGTKTSTYILVNFTQKLILIGGTYYAGEMKKSIFSVLNFLLPQKGVMGMHCSANVGKDGDTALFFGL